MQRDNKTSGWVDFYRNNKETRNPIKLNQDLFNKGIVAISYRNTNPDQFANQSMITLGNRTFAQYRRIESCVIISVKTDLTIDEILDEERLITPFNNEFPFNDEVVSDNHAITTLLKKMESAYILTNTNLYFVKKTIDNKLEISVLNFHEKNNLEALRTKLTQLKQPKLSSTHSFLNQNITVLFEFENASPSATPLKIINSMTGHHLNDGPSTDKQKKLLDWLTKDNKQITYNKKNCLGNIKRREEVFIPVAVHSKEKTGFNIYPWTSTNFPDAPFRGFKQVVTAGCMFGSYFLGLIKLYDTAKKNAQTRSSIYRQRKNNRCSMH